MSQQTSLATGKRYGLKRVCEAWDFHRSTFYAKQARLKTPSSRSGLKTRSGPKSFVSDEELLKLIRKDLENSPFTGEGHRKIHARLKRKGYEIGKNRVLRLMREHNLLSPHRVKQGKIKPHDGRIITNAPNQMWAADAAKVETGDGWAWVFWSIEHWNAECMGWHVAKRGDRFAALEPIAMGLEKAFGSTLAEVGRGLKLRIDHGSQYKSEDFINQIRYWGIAPSMGFVKEPETNGVVERFNRTFKEQVIYGRVYRNIEELRERIRQFIEDYNTSWLLEKLGYKSPKEAREEWHMQERRTANSTLLAEGERSTATSLGYKKSEKKIHRVPSDERSTATSLGSSMLASVES